MTTTLVFTVTCTGTGTSTTRITLSTGQSGTYTSRRLTSGANSLNYNIYTDATFTTVWGDGTAGTSYVYPANANNVHAPGTFTIVAYARIPGSQPVPPPGNYQDSVTATLTCTNGGACTTAANENLVVPITAPPAAGCTVSSSNLDFGAYNPGATTPRTSQATIIAHCPSGQAYMVGLSAGSYPGATTTSRRMATTGATDTLSYGLFSDPAGTVNWGDSFAGATQDVVVGTGAGVDQELPVFGRIDPGQYVRAGQYEDTVVVTLEF